MAYHNGSVWPHGNSLIAQGLARDGLGDLALQIWTGMFEAGLYFDLHRMPELFCGFPQAPGKGPSLYPVACAPQSWSAASVFLLFQACLGEINAGRAVVVGQELGIAAPVDDYIDLARSLLRWEVELESRGKDVSLELMSVSGLQHCDEPLEEGQATKPCGKDFLARLNAGFGKCFPQGRECDIPLGDRGKAQQLCSLRQGQQGVQLDLKVLSELIDVGALLRCLVQVFK
jgi:hypothetical protein